jgi:dynein heavy chain
MRRFAQDRALMAAKESRKTIALYNRVARALVEYEVLWHASWLRRVHAAKAALGCTLILKDAATGAAASSPGNQLARNLEGNPVSQH